MDTVPLVQNTSVFFRNCSSLIALVVLLYDHIITFKFEYKHVWKTSLTPVKVVYIFSRYFGLTCQTLNAALLFTKLHHAPITLTLCRFWFTFVLVSANVLATLMHSIIMLRVYALHHKDKKVGTILALLQMTAICLCIRSWISTYRENVYDDSCVLRRIPPCMLQFGIFVITGQTIIISLTLAKRKVKTQYVAIVRRVVRDGGGFFAFMAVFAITLILPSVRAVRATLLNFAFMWMLTIAPVVTCRLIKGSLQLSAEPLTECSSSSEGVELTSYIDLE
ncbi:hypothetical protein BDQ17DRAFT_854383 [Cyathus striatus]|nr:hypothetical protein BDQ17DRAFT_854383 [Cyathus striatus]